MPVFCWGSVRCSHIFSAVSTKPSFALPLATPTSQLHAWSWAGHQDLVFCFRVRLLGVDRMETLVHINSEETFLSFVPPKNKSLFFSYVIRVHYKKRLKQ